MGISLLSIQNLHITKLPENIILSLRLITFTESRGTTYIQACLSSLPNQFSEFYSSQTQKSSEPPSAHVFPHRNSPRPQKTLDPSLTPNSPYDPVHATRQHPALSPPPDLPRSVRLVHRLPSPSQRIPSRLLATRLGGNRPHLRRGVFPHRRSGCKDGFHSAVV